jgi:uncharacterized protein (DUF362 family)
VFVLPNFVVDRRPGEELEDFFGKCTHGSVLRAVLDYATIAAGDPRYISFGNASLQSCDFERVTEQTGAASIGQYYKKWADADIGPVDLRAVVSQWTRYGAMLDRREQHPEDVVLVDLGKSSLLDEFYRAGSAVAFRVSDYDHRDIAEYHDRGRHIYAVNRRVLEANTIISVPKLKTHEKVGITCALKGTVGSIARKECLAHHRKGGPRQHGDEYPRNSPLHDLASAFAERVTRLDSTVASNVARVASKGLYRLLRLGPAGIMAGAWRGNDTAWRMALDIARVLRFARPDGTLADVEQRRHIVLIDGVIGGEAEGPVYPRGVNAGVVIFGSDPLWADVAAARVMQFAPESIPLLSSSVPMGKYPLTNTAIDDVEFVIDGRPANVSALSSVLDRGFVPPKGWGEHVALRA